LSVHPSGPGPKSKTTGISACWLQLLVHNGKITVIFGNEYWALKS